MRKSGIDPGALARYLAGEATAEEEQHITAWLDADPSARIELESGQLQAPADPDAFLASVFDRNPAMQPRVDRPGIPKKPIHRGATLWTWPVRVAAILLIVASVGAAALWTIAERAATTETVWAKTFSTAPGERSTVRLADGTIVELSVASTLRIGAGFGTTSRVVNLNGEAFFDVMRNEQVPFVVRAGGASVEVLGTSFNVESYRDINRIQVSVSDGRVRFGDDSRQVLLNGGQAGRMDRYDDTPIVTTRIDPQDAAAWRNDILSFAGVPLHEVAEELSRWFDAEVAVSDFEIAERRVDGTYVEASLEAVAQSIAEALGVSVTQNGRRITFDRRSNP